MTLSSSEPSTSELSSATASDARLESLRREFHRTRGEEWANGITHMLGVCFGIVALTLMCVFAAWHGNAWHVTSCAIYGATLIILFKNSMLYHLVSHLRAKRVMQILDHVSIYLLIAGTYTPFALVTLRGQSGWLIFGVVWGLALLGISFETFLPKVAKYASLPIYLAMGWIAVMVWGQMRISLAPGGMIMLVVGGVVYTLGVIFYLLDKVPYMHTVWHLFVLGGSVCHWVCITFHVIPWS